MEQRFDWAIAGQERGPDAVCDRALFVDSRAVITPSLGSIVPGWLLVIPRRRVLSYVAVRVSDRIGILRTSRDFANNLIKFAPNVFVLEHGPRATATMMGCGVDQAH